MMCSFRCFFDCKTSSYLITSCTYNTKETTTDALLYNLMFILFDIIIYIRDYLYIVRHYRKIKCEKFEDGERKIGHGKKKIMSVLYRQSCTHEMQSFSACIGCCDDNNVAAYIQYNKFVNVCVSSCHISIGNNSFIEFTAEE